VTGLLQTMDIKKAVGAYSACGGSYIKCSENGLQTLLTIVFKRLAPPVKSPGAGLLAEVQAVITSAMVDSTVPRIMAMIFTKK
jgi:hypothetical protein